MRRGDDFPHHERVDCAVGGVSDPRGYIIYRGPSLLTGAPIVAIALTISKNSKTGDAAQTYILSDGLERPTEAMRSGADEAICGDCKHRFVNARTCYVVVRQGATAVWAGLQRGIYPDRSDDPLFVSYALTGRVVRLGSYGDPAAVPTSVWRALTTKLAGWVGYTHQWRAPLAQPLRDLCMASVDSPEEMAIARSMGWRTFRVRLPDEALQPREAVCPASEEGGHKLQCSTCRACNGAQGARGAIAIMVHGNHPEHREARFRGIRVMEQAA